MEQVKYRLRLNCSATTLNHSPALSLACHPTTPCPIVSGVSIAAEFAGDGSLCLRYRISGDPAKMRLPTAQPPGTADNLWQHTCCEAFIATGAGGQYREFNFSPSGAWAAYQFNAYRQRDSHFVAAAAALITFNRHAAGFDLLARLPPQLLPPLAACELGIAVIIESGDASKSYWALAHCGEQPDFHCRQSFTLALTPNIP